MPPSLRTTRDFLQAPAAPEQVSTRLMPADAPPGGASSATTLHTNHLAERASPHRPAILRYLRVLGAPTDVAEDLTQESFLRLLDHQRDIRDPRAVVGWLRRVARNLYFRHHRTRGDLLLDGDALECAVARHEGSDQGATYRAALGDALRLIPSRQAQALRLRYADGGGRAAVMAAFGISDEGAKALLRRARKNLMARMQPLLRESDDHA